MRVNAALFAALAMALSSPVGLVGQSAQTTPSVSVPRLVSVTGVYQPANGQPPPPGTVVTLLVYADPQGGTPLWQETQNVEFDASGHFTLLLGASLADGIPAEVFASGDAKWLALHFAGMGEVEGPRSRITSVPYALRSANADTLGGKPASAYVLAQPAAGTSTAANGTQTSAKSDRQATTQGATTQSATTGWIPVATDSVGGLGNSVMFQSGSNFIGVGTTTPNDAVHAVVNDGAGNFTGYAVQNLSGGAFAYSGMLFYDHTGALTQFQGYNNITHEYRINNIARVSPGGAFNGSINFMLGGTSKFFVSPVTVGIGTTAPDTTSNLDVSNAVSGSGSTNLQISAFAANGFGSNLIGKKARGTQALPTSVLNNDGLLTLSGTGYGATGFAGVSSGVITMRASENWTDTAQGSYMNFATTANGTTGSVNRMTINSNGNVGIGVFGAQAPLEVSNFNGSAGAGSIFATTFTNAGTSLFVGRRARGTGAAPTAVLQGDNLAGFLAQGHTGTGFSPTRGGMFVVASENWTTAAQGTSLNFNTTPIGTTSPGTRMTINPFGDVGIGTFNPTAALEVSRSATDAAFAATVYTDTNPNNANPLYFARFANGTPATPSAAQSGQILGAWIASGYGATQFGDVVGGMGVIAQENFTDTAQGAATGLLSTAIGSNQTQLHLAVLPSGFVGIGDWNVPAQNPTATDRLQVFGDARVGTSGTNGCLKRFDGTGLVGTCSSDRRLKKDIRSFGPVLNQLTALQPVHFFWRAAEFPDRHFGNSQTYGLIAQDVEQILPEIVVTGEDGFKAIDYSKLPLLTIQAVKELKAENDVLKAQNDALKDRVAEIERLIKEMHPTPQR